MIKPVLLVAAFAAAVLSISCSREPSGGNARSTPTPSIPVETRQLAAPTPAPGLRDASSFQPEKAAPATTAPPVIVPPTTGMMTEKSGSALAVLPTVPVSSSVAFAAIGKAPAKPLIQVESRPLGNGPTLAGLDVLVREDFRRLKGKKIGLLTNHSAIDRDGRHMLDLILGRNDLQVKNLFSPEHGLYGKVDTKTPDFRDTATGLMVHSLYSDKPANPKKPNSPRPADLKGLDVVVVDMQDIGARFYTYCSFMGYMMEECAPLGVEVMVLDRPNPIGGLYVDGPLMDQDIEGAATGYFRMPVAHGMTMGELARMFNAEKKIGCKLTVVECENWTRDMFLDQTGLLWVDPSPNIQNLDAAIVYPGIAIPESQVSMGRGTKEPFHVFGAPYIDNPTEMVDYLTSGGLPGMRLEVADFTPTGTLAKGHVGERKLCRGARMILTDRTKARPILLGVRLLHYLNEKFGSVMIPEYEWSRTAKATVPTGRIIPRFDVMRLRGASSAILCARVRENRSVASTMEFIDRQVAEFMGVRAKYLIYPPAAR